MTHADWIDFAKSIIGSFVVFYLGVWFLESGRAGSWRVAHATLWKKPKKWQLITLSVLWTIIIVAFIVALSMRRSK
jgi:flagellar biosynthesis protein FlhB